MDTDPGEPGALLLAAYDAQLRAGSEVTGADEVHRDGPLWLARFGDRGHVTYRDLDGLAGAELVALVERTVHRFAEDARVTHFEWKTRGHDAAAELPDVLLAAGLQADPLETVMVGEASAVAAAGPGRLPEPVELVRVDEAPDASVWITRAALMQAEVFGGGPTPALVLARQAARADLAEYWIARVGDEVVCAGRLELDRDSEFAGLWGGATRPQWRGHGIYRALASARATAALARGVRLLHSDCSAMSLPILERAGLRPVTTTTPYLWRRGD